MDIRNDQIAIVHGATSDMSLLTQVTFPNHAHYARKHGYQLHEFKFQPSEGVWEKIRGLQEAFGNAKIRRAFWIDADAIFTNSELSLMEHLPQGKIVAACDIFGINCGCLWLENCQEVRRFLWALATRGRQLFDQALWQEQTAIAHLAKHPPYCELITYVSQSRMNAYLNENYKGRQNCSFGQWQPGDFILHLPGMANSERIRILKTLFAKIPGNATHS